MFYSCIWSPPMVNYLYRQYGVPSHYFTKNWPEVQTTLIVVQNCLRPSGKRDLIKICVNFQLLLEAMLSTYILNKNNHYKFLFPNLDILFYCREKKWQTELWNISTPMQYLCSQCQVAVTTIETGYASLIMHKRNIVHTNDKNNAQPFFLLIINKY